MWIDFGGKRLTYLVLARKWRPSVFDDVVGQNHITRTLRNAVAKDRVPHALLFRAVAGLAILCAGFWRKR